MFQGRKRAATQRDFAQIVERLHDRAYQPDFFTDAPLGVSTPSYFWAIKDRRLTAEPRAASQRQRFELPCDPLFDDAGQPGEAPEFDAFLEATFAGPDKDAQTALAEEILGAAVLGQLALLQIAVLLWGKTRAGKGTFVRIVEALFPRDVITSVSPASWGHEYHRAALAGMRLNVVGEVEAKRPIPAGDFKSLIGRDLIGARHPTHSPFAFRNEAAHIFSGNFFPPATDRDPAFYIRWRILKFDNSVAGREDIHLSDRIIANEMPMVLARALKGAERVARRGALASTDTHVELLDRWRVEHSSALSFLLDADVVTLGPEGAVKRKALFDAYVAWCRAEGRHALGSHSFYAELRATAGRWGVEEERHPDEGFRFTGAALVAKIG
jgi:putative DNA primase/helicase